MQIAAELTTMSPSDALNYLLGPAKSMDVEPQMLADCVAVVRKAASEAPITVATAPLAAVTTSPASKTSPPFDKSLKLKPRFNSIRLAFVLVATLYVWATIAPPTSLPLGLQRVRSLVLLPFAMLKLGCAKVAVAVTARLA